MAKKRKSRKLLWLILGGVVLVLILIVILKPKNEVKSKVEVSKVTRSTIVEKVSASGVVQPVIEIKISPEVSGEIINLFVEEGDSVKKDELLIKLRPDNFQSALERAKANFNQQKANVSQAKSGMLRAEASLSRVKQGFERQEKLYNQKVISEADFQEAEASYKISNQDYLSAKESVTASEFVLKSFAATVNEASENLKLTRLSAPMSGIVSKLLVEEGETVLGTSQFQGTEVLRIADLSKMEVRVDVNENDIIKVNEEDTVEIEIDAYSHLNKKFKGVVTHIANSANDKISSDAITEFDVHIEILNDSYKELVEELGFQYPFRPGMTASIEIITEVRRDILTVPLIAVTTRPRKAAKSEKLETSDAGDEDFEIGEIDEVVFVVEGDKVLKKIVKTGIGDYERIEILSGLSEDQKVVSGSYLEISKRLKDGKMVTYDDDTQADKEE